MPFLYERDDLPPHGGHGSRALWDDIKKEYFVKLLCKYISHSSKRNALNRETWVKITKEMKIKFPESNFSMVQLKQLERDLKKLYKSIKCIESEPGFRWDDSDNMLKASNDDWQKLFERDLKARKWHGKILPYYTRLNALYGGFHETQVAQSKHETYASFYLSKGSMSMLTDANEEVDESLTTNPNQCANSKTLLNLSMSQNPDKESCFQDLNLLPKTPMLTGARMNKQNESLFSNQECQRNCRFEIEPMMENPSFTNHKFSIHQCIDEYYQLPGFQQSDLLCVAEIFKDEQNRELFLTLRRSERGFWLRANIDVRRQMIDVEQKSFYIL